MKYIAVFLATCILFLSPVPGNANGLHHQVSASCFKKSSPTDHCGGQKHIPCNDCSKGTCNTMMSCSTGGFLMSSSIVVSPVMLDLSSQITYPFSTGELSEYQDNDWNPPKA
jgi:hypothetical protein